jgi:SAM-dependent methyltransferase
MDPLAFDEAVRVVHERLPLHGFMKPEYAAGYVERHRDSYRHITQTIQRLVPQGSAVLDFGCGAADKTGVVHLCGYRCSATDDLGAPEARTGRYRLAVLAFARELGIDYREAPHGTRPPFEPGTFDVVMLHDVIEHLHDSPRELLNDLVEFLKPEGYLFITVPSAVNIRKRINVLFGETNLPRYDSYYWYPGHYRGHIREYTKGDLRTLAGYLGLRIVKLHAVHHMLTVVPQVFRLPYLAVTAAFPGLRDSWCMVAQKPAGWVPRRATPEGVFDDVMKMLSR